MSGIYQDMSYWPLVVIGSGSTASNDEEIERFIAAQREMIARNEPFVELADMTDAQIVNAAQRRRLAEWLREAEEPSKKNCLGVSIYIPNPVLRGGMQAVLWLASLAVPMKTAGSIDEAFVHCRDWLRAANVPGRERADRYIDMRARRVG